MHHHTSARARERRYVNMSDGVAVEKQKSASDSGQGRQSFRHALYCRQQSSRAIFFAKKKRGPLAQFMNAGPSRTLTFNV